MCNSDRTFVAISSSLLRDPRLAQPESSVCPRCFASRLWAMNLAPVSGARHQGLPLLRGSRFPAHFRRALGQDGDRTSLMAQCRRPDGSRSTARQKLLRHPGTGCRRTKSPSPERGSAARRTPGIDDVQLRWFPNLKEAV